MKQWWQCTIITMYENLRLCTLLFLTLLLAYGNSGSSDHNLSLLILVIRECILNLLKSCDQGSSRRIQKWQSGNSRIILTFYLNPRRIFYFSFFPPQRIFFKKSPTPSHTQCLPASLSLSLSLTSNTTRTFLHSAEKFSGSCWDLNHWDAKNLLCGRIGEKKIGE